MKHIIPIMILFLCGCAHGQFESEEYLQLVTDRNIKHATDANVYIQFSDDKIDCGGREVRGCAQRVPPFDWYKITVWNKARDVTKVLQHEIWHVELWERGMDAEYHHTYMRRHGIGYNYCGE